MRTLGGAQRECGVAGEESGEPRGFETCKPVEIRTSRRRFGMNSGTEQGGVTEQRGGAIDCHAGMSTDCAIRLTRAIERGGRHSRK